jgi:hypothetical protein
MKPFSAFCNIAENFKNFVGPDSIEDRKVWADRVWDLLQKTYAKIGGIKGSGFTSADDMVKNIPFWKLFTRGENVLVVLLYKEKSGRKIVALATDGSNEAKDILTDVFKNGLKVAWGEKSKAVLIYMMSVVGIDALRPFLLKPKQAGELLKTEVLKLTPELVDQLSKHDSLVYRRYKDELEDYFYVRKIGTEYFLKVAIGTPNKTIS